MAITIFDTETSRFSGNLPWHPNAFFVSLCLKHITDTEVETKTYIFNHQDIKTYMYHDLYKEEIQNYFNNSELAIAHNLKFDLHWLRKLGINLYKSKLWCTYVAEYILSGQQLKYGDLSLATTAKRRGVTNKTDLVKQWWDNGYETDTIPLEVLVPYGETDVQSCYEIYLDQQKQLQEQENSQHKIIQLRCESLRVTEDIEWNGMMTNVPKATEYATEYGATIDTLTKDVYSYLYSALQMPDTVLLNLNSPQHLSAILFGGDIKYKGKETVTRIVKEKITIPNGFTKDGREKTKNIQVDTEKVYERNAILIFSTKGLGFIPEDNTATAEEGYWSTDVNQLSFLQKQANTQEKQDILAALSELSKLEKMKGTYFDVIVEKNIDGLLHPTINECNTETGRYSCKDPNTQNIPRGSTSPVKEVYISRYDVQE